MAIRQTVVTLTETEGGEPFVAINSMEWDNEEGGMGDGQFFSSTKAPAIMAEAVKFIESRFKAEVELAQRTERLDIIYREETGEQEADPRRVQEYWQSVADYRKRQVGNRVAKTLMDMRESDLRNWAKAYNKSCEQ